MLGNKGSKKNYRDGGTRGGLDQFKWEDVKTDKYRENYLGHSVLAPVGRWQKGRDLTWYAKDGQKKSESELLEDEKRRMREMDEELLNGALGVKSTKKRTYETSLDNVEIKHYLSRGEIERSEHDIGRVKGLGAAQSKFHEHIERQSFAEKELQRFKEGKSSSVESINRLEGTFDTSLSVPSESKSFEVGDHLSSGKSKSDKKHDKKEKKEKKEKKDKKDKDKKHHKHSSNSSSGGGSSGDRDRHTSYESRRDRSRSDSRDRRH